MEISLAELNQQLKGTGITAKRVGSFIHYFVRVMHKGKRMSATFYSISEAQEAIVRFKLGYALPEPTKIVTPVIEEAKIVWMQEQTRAGTTNISRSEAFLILADVPTHELSSDTPYQSMREDGTPIYIPKKIVAEFLELYFNESEDLAKILATGRKGNRAQEIVQIYEEEEAQQRALGLDDDPISSSFGNSFNSGKSIEELIEEIGDVTSTQQQSQG